jgi:hypothetical protein
MRIAEAAIVRQSDFADDETAARLQCRLGQLSGLHFGAFGRPGAHMQRLLDPTERKSHHV